MKKVVDSLIAVVAIILSSSLILRSLFRAFRSSCSSFLEDVCLK